ncbi:MAG: NAD(P)/FAD-dependent oxidoreductase [Bauldia sp.]|nr:NAD(P)/FAD-dependent oxidoreductase [Bauldia sp.]
MTYDAVIIGGGPAGGTVAILLARAGWRVALVEKTPFPRRKVCGEFVSATSLALLDALGVGAAFRSLAGPEVREVGLFAGQSTLAAPMPRGQGVTAEGGRAVGRHHLDLLLLEAAREAGAVIHQPWSAVAVERRERESIVTLAAKDAREELHARIVIAAHGSWEPAAFLMDERPAHRGADLLAFKARFFGSRLTPGLMPLLAFPGGYGGMVHTDGGATSLSCCIRRDTLQRARAESPGLSAAEAVLAHIVEHTAGVREALAGASLDGHWLAAGPIRPGIRPRFAGGVFRVGNLAGEAHPIIAEGISMAMQSSWLLANALTREAFDPGRVEAAARRYSGDWRRSFATRIRAAALFAAVAARRHAPAAIVPVARRLPGLITLGADLSGKTRQIVR